MVYSYNENSYFKIIMQVTYINMGNIYVFNEKSQIINIIYSITNLYFKNMNLYVNLCVRVCMYFLMHEKCLHLQHCV